MNRCSRLDVLRRVLLGGLLAAVLVLPRSGNAFVLVGGCYSVGTAQFQPVFPSSSDAVGYWIYVPPDLLPLYRYILVKEAYQPTPPETVVTVVLTNDPAPFPDYRPVNAFDQNFGFLGPFPQPAVPPPPGQATTFIVEGLVYVYSEEGGLQYACDPTIYDVNQTSAIYLYAPTDPFYLKGKAVSAPVIEFYSVALDDYFITMDPREIQALDTGSIPGWTRTGESFLAYLPLYLGGIQLGFNTFNNLVTSTAVARYYGLPGSGINSHFFTVDYYETMVPYGGAPVLSGWELETPEAFDLLQPLSADGSCPVNTEPVYRLLNGFRHRYTTDLSVRQQMITAGWLPEGFGPIGVVMCAPTE